MLNKQDNLYHVNLQGLDKGKTVNSLELIDVISRSLNPYTDFEAFIRLAEQPEMRFVISIRPKPESLSTRPADWRMLRQLPIPAN